MNLRLFFIVSSSVALGYAAGQFSSRVAFFICIAGGAVIGALSALSERP